jgi:hypothetical protein
MTVTEGDANVNETPSQQARRLAAARQASTQAPDDVQRLPSAEEAAARLQGTAVGRTIDQRIGELTDECRQLEELLRSTRATKKRMEAMLRLVARLTDEQIAALDPHDPNSWIPVDARLLE